MWGYCTAWSGKEKSGEKSLHSRTAVFAAGAWPFCGLLPVSGPRQLRSLWERLFWTREEPEEPLTDEEREENVRIITAFLREEMELPDSAVAAMLANMYRESAFDPRAVDGSGKFFGLCQWSEPAGSTAISSAGRRGWTVSDGGAAGLPAATSWKGSTDWIYETFLLAAEDSEDGAQEAQYYFCELFEVPLDLDWEQVVRSKLVAYVYWP